MIAVTRLLCGCAYGTDNMGRVLWVNTCPWCNSLRLVNMELADREKTCSIDKVVSVSALDEDEDAPAHSDKSIPPGG